MADNLTNTSNVEDQTVWLSIGEAAELLGLSRDTLRRWEKVGKIKVYRSPTNRRIYKQSDLEELYKTKGKEIRTPPQVSQTYAKIEPIEAKVASSIPVVPVTTEVPKKEEPQEKKPIATPVSVLEVTEKKESDPVNPLSNPTPQVPTTNIQSVPPTVKATSNPQPVFDSAISFQNVKQPTVPTVGNQSLQPRDGLMNSLTMPTVPATYLPATPVSRHVNENNTDENDKKKEESNSAKLLKAVAITLALILVGLGITITILVFA